MTHPKWFTIIGAVFLLAGLVTAFLSSHYTAKIQGPRRMGAIVFGPEKGSTEWIQTERLLTFADGCFYVGLALTGIGVVLQAVGTVLALRTSSRGDDPSTKEEPDDVRSANDKNAPLETLIDPTADVPIVELTKLPPDDIETDRHGFEAIKRVNEILAKKPHTK